MRHKLKVLWGKGRTKDTLRFLKTFGGRSESHLNNDANLKVNTSDPFHKKNMCI